MQSAVLVLVVSHMGGRVSVKLYLIFTLLTGKEGAVHLAKVLKGIIRTHPRNKVLICTNLWLFCLIKQDGYFEWGSLMA